MDQICFFDAETVNFFSVFASSFNESALFDQCPLNFLAGGVDILFKMWQYFRCFLTKLLIFLVLQQNGYYFK